MVAAADSSLPMVAGSFLGAEFFDQGNEALAATKGAPMDGPG